MADVRFIHQFVDALPPNGQWSAEQRRKWLHALECAVDFAIDITTEEITP